LVSELPAGLSFVFIRALPGDFALTAAGNYSMSRIMMKCMIKKLSIVCLMFALGIGYTAGCASMKPYDYKNEADEQKSGPGLISGEKGEFTIFRIPDKSKEQTDESQAPDASKKTPKHD
jgi:hypothetical protein